jgi:hypothetical protein
MPTEHISPPEPPRPFEAHSALPAAPQIKHCSTCYGPLADTTELVFTLGRMGPDDICTAPAVVCSACAERAHTAVLFADPLIQAGARMRRLSTLEPMVEESLHESDGETSTSTSPALPQTPPPAPADTRPVRADVLAPLRIPARSPVRTHQACAHSFAFDPHSASAHVVHSAVAVQHRPRSLTAPPSPPLSFGTPQLACTDASAFYQELDPYADVTRLRLKNTRQDCLYPGASFVGIQKSGRNSYNVSVTIVVCDPFSNSTRSRSVTDHCLPERRLSWIYALRLPHYRKPH